MREVRNGGTIVMTTRGRAVARMMADGGSLRERLELLTNAGVMLWNGQQLKPMKRVARVRAGRRTVADLISENRE